MENEIVLKIEVGRYKKQNGSVPNKKFANSAEI